MEPNAQGEGTQPQIANDGNNEVSDVQKRINELTAEKYKALEERNATVEQNKQLTNTLAQLMARLESNATQNQEPPVEISDEEKKKFDAYAAPQLKRMEAMVASMQQQMAISNVNPLAQKYNVPAEVAERAREIIRTQRNVPEETAIKYAYGELAIAGKLSSNRQNNNNLASNNVLNGGGGIPKGDFAPQGNPAAYPANFNDWDPSARIKWIRKNRPDIEDAPL